MSGRRHGISAAGGLLLLFCALALGPLLGCDDGEELANDDVVDATDVAGDVADDTRDPCEEVDPGVCEAEGAQCDASTQVSCGLDADGCLVETAREDCAAVENGVCDATQGTCVVIDPCEGVTNCSEAGTTRCEGDAIMTCEADARGCLVESPFDCAATGATCVEDAGPGGSDVCGFDPCALVEVPCDAEARSCTGDELVVCERNVYNCLEQRTYDCSAVEGTCAEDGVPAHCTLSVACQDDCVVEGRTCTADNELELCKMDRFGCMKQSVARCGQTQLGLGYCDSALSPAACNVTFDTSCDQFTQCTTEGSSCKDDTLVKCEMNVFGCLVETRTDCQLGGAPCVSDGQDGAVCGDPCDQVETCSIEDYCIGDELVHCTENPFGCLVVDTVTDCTAMDMRCDNSQTPPMCSDLPENIDLTASPGATISSASTAVSTLQVADPCTVLDVVVDVNITHSWKGDVTLTLQNPGGTSVTLHNQSGGSANDIIGTYPTTLTVEGPGALADFSGQSGQGTWTLTAADAYSGDNGTLNSWGLHLVCD